MRTVASKCGELLAELSQDCQLQLMNRTLEPVQCSLYDVTLLEHLFTSQVKYLCTFANKQIGS